MSEKMRNTSFLISDSEEEKLLKLMAHLQKSNLTKLTKSDVLRHLINKAYEEMVNTK